MFVQVLRAVVLNAALVPEREIQDVKILAENIIELRCISKVPCRQLFEGYGSIGAATVAKRNCKHLDVYIEIWRAWR